MISQEGADRVLTGDGENVPAGLTVDPAHRVSLLVRREPLDLMLARAAERLLSATALPGGTPWKPKWDGFLSLAVADAQVLQPGLGRPIIDQRIHLRARRVLDRQPSHPLRNTRVHSTRG
jgi:hypothetical protein